MVDVVASTRPAAKPKHILAIHNAITCANYAIQIIANEMVDSIDSDQAMLSVEDLGEAVHRMNNALLIIGDPGYEPN